MKRLSRLEEQKSPILRPGQVTALEPQVKHPDRLNLYIDDHFVMGLSAYVAAGVHVGQTLTLDRLQALARAEQVEAGREVALRRLETRPRSQSEIRRALESKGFAPDICDQVLAGLTDSRLINDRDFARFWVENREGFKPRSVRALKHELRQKGVSSEEIARAVNKVDENDSAYRAAKPRAERLTKLDADEFRQKLTGFLARRGFSYQVSRGVVARLWTELRGEHLEDQDMTDL